MMMRWMTGVALSAAFTAQAVSGPEIQIVTGQNECIHAPEAIAFQRDVFKETPTGKKGESTLYHVEIWANTAKGSWTLLGTPKNDAMVDPAIKRPVLCALDAGTSGYPDDVYMKYRDYFPKP